MNGQLDLQRSVHDLYSRQIANAIEPKVVAYNGGSFVTARLSSSRASRLLNHPCCLGVYDFGSDPKQIVDDLQIILDQQGLNTVKD